PLAVGDLPGRGDDLDGPVLCCRAIFFAWVRKLLVLPVRGASERMRPGFGRKRISSSALMDAPSAKTQENRAIGAHGAGRNPARPRLCATLRHAGSKSMVPLADHLTSVQTTINSEIRPT